MPCQTTSNSPNFQFSLISSTDLLAFERPRAERQRRPLASNFRFGGHAVNQADGSRHINNAGQASFANFEAAGNRSISALHTVARLAVQGSASFLRTRFNNATPTSRADARRRVCTSNVGRMQLSDACTEAANSTPARHRQRRNNKCR